MGKKNTTWDFIGLIFGSFFRWWWAAITGVASIASWLLLPSTGITLNPIISTLLIFVGSAFLFLTLTTVYRGWKIYQTGLEGFYVESILKNDCYGGEHIIKLSNPADIMQGTIIQLSRFHDGVEVPIALAEIVEKNSREEYQANPIWFAKNHLYDFKMGRYTCSENNATTSIHIKTVEKAKESIWGNR